MLTFDSLTLTLTESLKHLESLEDCYMAQEKFQSSFKVFLQTLNICFAELSTSLKSICSVPRKKKILLYLSQIFKSLKLFAHLVQHPLYRQGVWYVCERLRCCVSELRSVCCSPDMSMDVANDGDSGVFVHLVDAALQQVETKGAAVARETSWTLLINDVICQAVTIAKIAAAVDYNEITSACQQILEQNSNLTKEDLPNSNQLSLLADSLFNTLISLEERVNLAILRLVLQVFSDPSRPVKQVVKQCRKAAVSRSLADLDSLVGELDAHIERVMLIGQFAVSCCEDDARVRGVRCCLASVESIDNYLVPALKALYLTPGCEDKRRFAQLLCDHWQDEVSALHSHLNNIIDSPAFVTVTVTVVQESVNELSDQMNKEEVVDDLGNTIVKQTWLLYKHLNSSGVDLTQLKQSVGELEAAVNQQAPRAAVVKRARLVAAAVDQLALLLTSPELSQQPLSSSQHPADPDSSPIEKSLRDIPLDVSISSTKSQYAAFRPQWLQRKICEVKKNRLKESFKAQVVKDMRDSCTQSVVTPKCEPVATFHTPKNKIKTENDLLTPFLSKTAERSTTLYVRTPRLAIQNQLMEMSRNSDCSWSSFSCQDSLALEISDILENLTQLADTLSSEKEAEGSSWQQPQPSPPADVMKRYFSGASFDSQWFSLASVRTDEVSADVDTLDRIQDIKLVDEKIRSLKL